ncbi:Leucine rich repeats (6 copies) [Prevotella melaninogenica]|uniref:leucine-rich repeat domain-containing protein n=1 Tax=Prevotella melaninogenica TaxID=28132 RepID=UPI00195B6B36|nr:leucine-rich repeat domain-containing protein [Prevotella melaninogenica]VTY09327.1 Leucine rich repeats (6 copies) [Prevotella melaninogenica]
MKRKLLLLLLAFISLGCFADSQPTDSERRANLFVYNKMLFSIQKFVSVSSQENAVEFCGWTDLTDLSTDAKKDLALADAQYNAIRKVGEITIPETVTAAVTYNGQLQGNATYKVIMLRANLFRAAESGVTSQITKITIPKTVQHIESRCFDECVNMTEFVIEGATDGTSQLKEIDSHAFLNCKKLASITLPNSVTYLGDDDPNSIEGSGMFEGCESLTSFKFPSSYASRNLPGFTFKNCKNLATIDWNGYNPKRLNSCAFWNCDKITWSQVPQSVEELGDECFYDCAALTSVDLSKIKKMDTGVFWGTPLTSVEWPAAVTEIPARTFWACGQLTTIKGIPGQPGAWDNITKIGENAFNQCTALTTIKLPAELKTIDAQAFRTCINLATVDYGTKVETIGDGAFWYTGALKKFFFKGSVKTLGADAFRESGLTCVHLKGDMTIGKEAFMKCASLKYVEFPATSSATQPLTYVAESMFAGCTSLPFITLPSTVTEIKANAFNGCSNLKYVNILADSPATLGANAFPTTAGVYVKPSKLSAYQANTAWNAYNPKDTYEQTLATKYASFDHDFPVSFVAKNGHEALEAYVGPSTYRVTQPTKVQKILKMIKVTSTAANEGVLLKGEVGRTYTYQIAETDPGLYTGNRVIGVREDTTLVQTESDGKSNWVLQPDYKLHLVSNGTIKSGRAYVHEMNDGDTNFGAKGIYLSFALNEENNTTGIDSVENKKDDEENVYYTLSGVRVINPTEKGVYIKNGKKVIIR